MRPLHGEENPLGFTRTKKKGRLSMNKQHISCIIIIILSVPYSGYFSASSEHCEIPGSVPNVGFAKVTWV